MKKFVSITFVIQLIVYFVTLVGFTTVIFGLMAQFVLGCLQIILAIIYFCAFKRMDDASRKRLTIYAGCVLGYFAIGLPLVMNPSTMDIFDDNLLMAIAGGVVVPMVLGGYFLWLSKSIEFGLRPDRPKAIDDVLDTGLN